jgi:hypothetical protein
MIENLKYAVNLAIDWIADIAQVKTETLKTEHDTMGHKHAYWKGAIRGEYSAGKKETRIARDTRVLRFSGSA